MLTANRAFALTLTMAACGPVIDIDITSGATGDAGTTTADPATTGLGASESGPMEPGTTFGATSGTGPGESGEDSSSGATGGSSSGGESPPVCTVYTDDLGAWHCECGDIVDDCGCAVNDAGLCECDAGIYPPEVCTPVCAVEWNGLDFDCVCYGEAVDPSECSCGPVLDACMCDGVEYPAETCVPPVIDPCEVVVVAGETVCECDGIPAAPEDCGCILTDAEVCECGEFGSFPADFCAPPVCVPGLPCWCEDLVPPQPCPAG